MHLYFYSKLIGIKIKQSSLIINSGGGGDDGVVRAFLNAQLLNDVFLLGYHG